MALQDLSYVFQPVIHEPLSKANGSNFGAVNKEVAASPQQEEQFVFFVGSDAINDNTESPCTPLSPGTSKKEETEALHCKEEADICRIKHPRKAMSLYLKAGKALVLCSEADSALDCFRSLIVLASNQLASVLQDKDKLPAFPQQHCDDRNPLSRSQSMGLPEKQKSVDVEGRRRNSHTGNIETAIMGQTECVEVTEVQENQVEFSTAVIESTDSTQIHATEAEVPIVVNCCEEPVQVVQEESVCTVSEVTGESSEVACDACVVECFEAPTLEFEVAMLDSSDDAHSVTSTEDIVRTINTEVVMECGEVMVLDEAAASSPEQNALIRRGYVVSELIDTEQSYVQDMEHVLKGYMNELASDHVPPDLKGKEKEIFANMKDIHEWHSNNFFTYLKQCEDAPSQLGEIFTNAESKLEELYTEYCRNKPKSDSLVICHKETFFRECRQRLGHRLQVTDYLIKPVQRITKYQLLLRDILKFTERAGEHGAEIQRALDVSLRILKRTNDMISVAMILGYEAKPEDTGELLLRGTLGVTDRKSKQKSKECSVFLFEKIILITEPCEEGGQSSLRFLNCIKVRGLGQTESVDSDPCKWAVWLRKRSSAEIYVLKAPSYEIKQQWMKTIKETNETKRPGLIKSAFNRAKSFRRDTEEKETSAIVTSLAPEQSSSRSSSRRGTSKRKTSKSGTKKKRGREAGLSDRLKENILKFRVEEQMLSIDDQEADMESDEHRPNSMTSSLEDTIPPSPDTTVTPDFADVVMRASHIEDGAKLEAEEIQLKKVLLLTRMIAARLLQFKDAEQSLSLYSDVIASVFPLESLRKLEPMYNTRDMLLQQCTDIYEQWRKESLQSGDLEESYSSMTSLLNETAGFCSLHKGSPWSVVLYSISAIAGSREQRWQNASQAFYRLSLVYSSLQVPCCAVDSLLDAHWMCCQAEDHQGAVNFFYNAFIRVLAYRDLLRSLRLEQQALFLIEMLNTRDRNNHSSHDPSTPSESRGHDSSTPSESRGHDSSTQSESRGHDSTQSESRGLVSSQHLSFLVNMSRATRQKDWAWFEIAETELNNIVSAGNGRQADAVLSAVFTKIRRSVGDPMAGL